MILTQLSFMRVKSLDPDNLGMLRQALVCLLTALQSTTTLKQWSYFRDNMFTEP